MLYRAEPTVRVRTEPAFLLVIATSEYFVSLEHVYPTYEAHLLLHGRKGIRQA